MAQIKALDFVAQGSNIDVAAGSFTELLTEFEKQEFGVVNPKGKPVVHRSGAGNLQLILANRKDIKQRVFIRISAALDSALENREKIDFNTCPVYMSDIMAEGVPTGRKMLVVGMPAAEVEFVKGGFKLDASMFVEKPEPAEAE
jgi:hypothetical protein